MQLTYSALIVDDNKVNLKVLEAYLVKAGYLVTCANSGRTAIEILKTEHFELIVLDSHMPDMDGAECAKRMRVLLADRLAPSLILGASADTTNLNREKCLTSGMDGFITKPFSLPGLLSAIEGLRQKQS